MTKLRAAAVRAGRTVAQTAVALIGTNAVGLTDIDWWHVADGALVAGVLSLLMSAAGNLPETQTAD